MSFHKTPLALSVFLLGVLALLALAGIYYFNSTQYAGAGGLKAPETAPDAQHVAVESEDAVFLKFSELSNAKTNFCAGPEVVVSSGAERLQGSCCSKMDFHRYTEQLEGLKKYAFIGQIPADPYDIPVSLAEKLLEYQKTIRLTAEQQEIYDDAVAMSHEGGPCCCKCWRWYAFEGLAKFLITEHGFDAEQIAEVWDLEDGCGGTGHAHSE